MRRWSCYVEGNGRKQALSSPEPQRVAAVFNVAQCDNLPDHNFVSAPAFFDQINYYRTLFHELSHNAEVRIIPRPMGLALRLGRFGPAGRHKASCQEHTEGEGRHRRPSQFRRPTRRAAHGIIAEQRTNSAHLHRPWHPEVSMHTHPLAAYVECLNRDDLGGVGDLMLSSARKLAAAGADFLICPDNTIHQAMGYVVQHSPLPWLHTYR